jgi:ABC-type Fe3+/spermidine/putrescine transport system ATPase subunit
MRFGGTVAVDRVSLDIPPFVLKSIIGPNGAGKTTFFNLLSGQYRPSAGRIEYKGRDVTALGAAARTRLGIGRSFQLTNIFPTLSVLENVRMAVQARRGVALNAWRPAGAFRELEDRAYALLQTVLLETKWRAAASELSHGEQRKLELGILLALEPEVLLLDEPMAALDLKLRQEMRVEVKNLQERLGITFVFVTHDQEEALVMSDRIAVMNRGRVEQVGAPEALYDRPRTRFVADFLAVRNLLQATVVSVSSGRAALRTPGGLAFEASDDGGYRAGTKVWIGVRPERISMVEGTDDGDNRLSGTLEDEIYLGDRTDWRVRVGEETVTVAESAAVARARRRGEPVTVSFPPDAVLRLEDAEAEGR